MPDMQSKLSPADAAQAVFYGQFVKAAYTMYESSPANPTPTPAVLPAGYNFSAWVQMRDFIFEEGNWTFYGFLAQKASSPNEFILAIRGTQDLTEWWDDLTSMIPVSWSGFGAVGYGFQRIYQTMRIIDYVPPPTIGAGLAPRSLEAFGTFANQVAAAARHHMVLGARLQAAPAPLAPLSIKVIGHSLGGALATLYVADNATGSKVGIPQICTFASPRVGDLVFRNAFDNLGIPSWRIVNELDLVPKLPYLGFWHVAVEYLYNSGWSVYWSPSCWHSLWTYLYLLDSSQPLLPDCVWSSAPAATTSLRQTAKAAPAAAAPAAPKEVALAAPADHGTTINITINVGQND